MITPYDPCSSLPIYTALENAERLQCCGAWHVFHVAASKTELLFAWLNTSLTVSQSLMSYIRLHQEQNTTTGMNEVPYSTHYIRFLLADQSCQ